MEAPEFKECPSCLGIGEVAIKKNKIDTCNICEGTGKVHPGIAQQFIGDLISWDSI
jgi:DnaJ-class molecular chaperone